MWKLAQHALQSIENIVPSATNTYLANWLHELSKNTSIDALLLPSNQNGLNSCSATMHTECAASTKVCSEQD